MQFSLLHLYSIHPSMWDDCNQDTPEKVNKLPLTTSHNIAEVPVAFCVASFFNAFDTVLYNFVLKLSNLLCHFAELDLQAQCVVWNLKIVISPIMTLLYNISNK